MGLRSTHAKDATQGHFLTNSHSQSPKNGHRQNDHNSIESEVQDADIDIQGFLISASATLDRMIPSKGYRPADKTICKDCGKHEGDIEAKCYVARCPEQVGSKDVNVKKHDGGADEGDSDYPDQRGDQLRLGVR